MSSNRDEIITRQTIKPMEYRVKGKNLIFPKDILSNGSWIAMDENGNVSCLLNGAFVKHKKDKVYSKSRGQVLLESLLFDSVEFFVNAVLLENVEPFTLLILKNNANELFFYELKWDGKNKHIKKLDNHSAQIWSSVTLYSNEIIARKNKHFEEFLLNFSNPNASEIFNFHQSNKDINDGGLLLKNEVLRTVSISQICLDNEKTIFTYQDLLLNERSEIENTLSYSTKNQDQTL